MADLILFIGTAVVLIALSYAFFPVARKHGMVAGVNSRSSHKRPVVTGAGFIFPLAFVAYFGLLLANAEPFPWFFAAALVSLAIISFIDDIRDVWFLYRILVQIAAVALMLVQLNFTPQSDLSTSLEGWLAMVALLVFMIGNINLYNFMDGINGMMGMLTLAIVIPCLLIDIFVVDYIDWRLLATTIVPTLIFLFFNFRNKPKCLSGDVGSITLGVVLTYTVVCLLVTTGNISYIFLMAVVYIEAGITVLQRLLSGNNIFKPHRIHYFQLLVNEGGKNHLVVSSTYAGIQFAFGMAIFAMNYFGVKELYQNCICWVAFLSMCLYYFYKKRQSMGGHFLHPDDHFVKQSSK